MTPPNKQFDPFTQGDQMSVEIDLWMQSGEAMLKRAAWIIGKQREELERLRAEHDSLEFYTEEQFAHLLQISTDKPARAKQALADLRARHQLPHHKIGQSVIYTKADISACLDIFQIKGVRQMKRAA